MRERLGEPTWRIVPSPQPAVGVGRNEGHHPGRRRNDLEHQLRGGYDQPAQPALLPRSNEGTHRGLVDDRRAS